MRHLCGMDSDQCLLIIYHMLVRTVPPKICTFPVAMAQMVGRHLVELANFCRGLSMPTLAWNIWRRARKRFQICSARTDSTTSHSLHKNKNHPILISETDWFSLFTVFLLGFDKRIFYQTTESQWYKIELFISIENIARLLPFIYKNEIIEITIGKLYRGIR